MKGPLDSSACECMRMHMYADTHSQYQVSLSELHRSRTLDVRSLAAHPAFPEASIFSELFAPFSVPRFDFACVYFSSLFFFLIILIVVCEMCRRDEWAIARPSTRAWSGLQIRDARQWAFIHSTLNGRELTASKPDPSPKLDRKLGCFENMRKFPPRSMEFFPSLNLWTGLYGPLEIRN